ncbi:transmembrane protein [Cystoisospora suis]|uniref:Transmembrane protein n=1 Tax=Cystoisospora suis TaxID=483139 RepID=A0A2C6LHH7_9APIC|nr:transmembrane protein [Cystoisospora suis]
MHGRITLTSSQPWKRCFIQTILFQSLVWSAHLLVTFADAEGFKFKGWDRRRAKCKVQGDNGKDVPGIKEFDALVMMNDLNEIVTFEPARAVPMCDISNGHGLAFTPCEDSASRPDHTRFVVSEAPEAAVKEESTDSDQQKPWFVTRMARAASGVASSAFAVGKTLGRHIRQYVSGEPPTIGQKLSAILEDLQKGYKPYVLKCKDPLSKSTLSSIPSPPMTSIVGYPAQVVRDFEQ